MKNLIELLRDSEKLRERLIKEGSAYGMAIPHLPEVLTLNKQYRAENPEAYGYNADIVRWIMERENVPAELEDILETQVYFSQKDLRAEKELEHKHIMEAEGWQELTEETKYRGKILLRAKIEVDLFANAIDKEAKIISDAEGRPFIIPKGSRTRGWRVSRLTNAFYKPLE